MCIGCIVCVLGCGIGGIYIIEQYILHTSITCPLSNCAWFCRAEIRSASFVSASLFCIGLRVYVEAGVCELDFGTGIALFTWKKGYC